MKHITLIALVLIPNLTAAQTPQYTVVGNLNIPATGEVVQASLDPTYSTVLNVPVEVADSIASFHTGFAIRAAVNGQAVILDSVQITGCTYSIYHLNVTTSAESPVLEVLEDGQDPSPLVNIPLTTFGTEQNAEPAIFITADGLEGEVVSTGDGSITDTVENVGAIFVTKHNRVSGPSPDFTQPILNQGYVVRWSVSFVPTYNGVQQPAITLHPEFVYKVTQFELPKVVRLVELRKEFQNWLPSNENGMIVEVSGSELEYCKVQRSTDLQNWADHPYGIAGDGWINSNTYRWFMFDPAFPNERRLAPREFFRVVWAGKRVIIKPWG